MCCFHERDGSTQSGGDVLRLNSRERFATILADLFTELNLHHKEECIPVGCVSPAAVDVSHAPMPCMPPCHAHPSRHAHPLPCTPLCHACPPATHAPHAMHAPCHTCPPAMHTPAMHTPSNARPRQCTPLP